MGVYMINESCKCYKKYSNIPSPSAKNLFFYVEWSGKFTCNDDFYIKRKLKDSIIILQTIKGKGKLLYRNKEYILTQNNFAMINSEDLHEYDPVSSEEWTFEFIHFSGNNCISMYEYVYELYNGCVFPQHQEIMTNVRKCIELSKEKGVAYEVKTSRLINNIMHDMICQIQQDDRDRISMVCDYIANNYTQRITTETLAKISCMSRCYLSTVFKKSTGFTLHNYLLLFRLNKAKVLLYESDMSISEIAEKSGFANSDSFIRFFKHKENITPAQYRKKKC